jgi:hypothetical protein
MTLAAIVAFLHLIVKYKALVNDFLGQMLEQQAVTQHSSDIDSNTINLINRINGVTTIWLESDTYADRLILKIPTFNYCNCIYLVDDGLGASWTNEIANYCFCGKNNLNLVLRNRSLLSAKILSDECTICLETYKLNDLSLCQLACCHNFHRNCIYKWFKTGQYTCESRYATCLTLFHCCFNRKLILKVPCVEGKQHNGHAWHPVLKWRRLATTTRPNQTNHKVHEVAVLMPGCIFRSLLSISRIAQIMSNFEIDSNFQFFLVSIRLL